MGHEFRVVALMCPGLKAGPNIFIQIFYYDTPSYWVFNSHLNTDRENTILPKSVSQSAATVKLWFYYENPNTVLRARKYEHIATFYAIENTKPEINRKSMKILKKKKKDYMQGCQANLI